MQSSAHRSFETPVDRAIDQRHGTNAQYGLQSHNGTNLPANSAEPGSGSDSVAFAAQSAAGSSHGSTDGRLTKAEHDKPKDNVETSLRSPQDGTNAIESSKSADDAKYAPNVLAAMPNEIMIHVLSHLPPADLAAVAILSRRFHDLVTSPHAWRSAFSRCFPGAESVRHLKSSENAEERAAIRSDKRSFTRLTPRATWRSEYMLRTRLLRSLVRGKPVQQTIGTTATPSNRLRNVSPEITYSSELFGSVNSLHATWTVGLNKRSTRLIHGASDICMSSLSECNTGKVERWGLTDPQILLNFQDRFPGDAQFGLGPGEVVGAPNVLDVSQPNGMACGEGFPGGKVYYRGATEMNGRYLSSCSTLSAPRDGIPLLAANEHAVTSIWLAKSSTITSLTDGMIGLLCGSSNGCMTAYSIGSSGPSNNRSNRFAKGEMTARWLLSPGVPIIAIAVDDNYSVKRQVENRIWAVVLNALGEVFYLTKFPRRPRAENGQKPSEEHLAWQSGRSVYWYLIETSRRVARPDPYDETTFDGSYSPRSSWNGMCLTAEQVEAETLEIQTFLDKKPKYFQKVCSGWDMRRRLEVDFAGDDSHHAGEAVIVFECGLDEGTSSNARRFLRLRCPEKAEFSLDQTPSMTTNSTPPSSPPSLFGHSQSPVLPRPDHPGLDKLEHSLSHDGLDGTATPRQSSEEWYVSRLSFGGLGKVKIMAVAIDSSTHAVQTQSEDPLLGAAEASATSSPALGPWSALDNAIHAADLPGQRARLLAIGTQTGSILVWNARESASSSTPNTTHVIEPVRVIFTDSPQISSLALSSLYLVHGGSDGLVQAWDPLASDDRPIRTLHSRFSSRARRQLLQAQASPQGVGTNMYAAAAICLDPDPTSLRGVVALGNRLRYWAYSSSVADRYKPSKRRLRRSERGSNNQGDRFSGATRNNLKDYIANERLELDREKKEKQKEANHLADRFGTDLMDGSEEEIIAYASMLSQESLAQDMMRRSSDTTSASNSSAVYGGEAWSSEHTPTPPGSSQMGPALVKTDEELDADIAEAIRQSMSIAESPPRFDVPIRVSKNKQRKGSSTRPSPSPCSPPAGPSKDAALSDPEFDI